ncbi:hypothetical protein AMAG_17204 [Allomyces macrogynus ATCC 38327]|uniref:F-box domain-containing protein n=1 Tax=Allomyces macrogynus (strain ATCC 38327) TaxID=578462 RepID=A0A0L0TE36_ALLM3|nr:hypothetical protein AMAG_17204 [Allomyces macrogynus ATCC 38327]|eukprot:KNE72987.1 hypothetical protein AMAG_17204 [Allomyces macrogynus ATCC 38327]
MVAAASVHWLRAHDYDASAKITRFQNHAPLKAMLNVGRIVETTHPPRLLLLLDCMGDIVTEVPENEEEEDDWTYSVPMDLIVIADHLPPEHPALLPLFRGLAVHGVTLRSLAISSVTLTTVTITVLTSALGPDLLDLELRIAESMETAILERVATRCPNVRTVVLAPPSDRYPLGGYQFGRALHQFKHLASLTVHRQLNEGAEAVAAAIMPVHQPDQQRVVPLRRLVVTGRMTSARSTEWHQPLNPAGTFRQPASKLDDSGLEMKVIPALWHAGQHLAVLHLDSLLHSPAVLARLIAVLPHMTALRDLGLSSCGMFQGASADVCAPFARAIPPRVRYLTLAECTVDEDGLRALVVESNVAMRRVIVVESVLPWMWDEARSEKEDAMAAGAMVQARRTAGKSGIVDVFVGTRAKRYWL